jgi:hypothetical protein
MIRLHFVVEGQTEETFVNYVLAPELSQQNIFPDVRCVQTGRKHGNVHKGGITNYIKLKNDLQRWLKQDQHIDARFTTMIDFYALPNDFPGYDESRKHTNSKERIAILETCFQADIGDPRFIPYIQKHEFEALLFTEPHQFATAYPNKYLEIQKLVVVRSEFVSPEDINEGKNTAPSKRIQAIFPDYNKNVTGPRIATKIGLIKIRAENPHFNEWLKKLEQLA